MVSMLNNKKIRENFFIFPSTRFLFFLKKFWAANRTVLCCVLLDGVLEIRTPQIVWVYPLAPELQVGVFSTACNHYEVWLQDDLHGIKTSTTNFINK
jgi:hypothetical protein